MNNGIIEELKYKKNTLMLVKKEHYTDNWQNPQKIIDYVTKNFKKVDEIGAFDVYSR